MTAITVTDLFLELSRQRPSEAIQVDIGESYVDVTGLRYNGAEGVVLEIAEDLCEASALKDAEKECADAELKAETFQELIRDFLTFAEDFDWDLLPEGWSDSIQTLTDKFNEAAE